MANFEFRESNYRFTQPVRYYKANDPVYYEVDNIHIKQLEENILWLKDQLQPQEIPEFVSTRSNFSELQPTVAGTDNIVKVSPGRFTARINDAYNITPLQIIQSLVLPEALELNAWQIPTFYNSVITPTLNKFKQTISSPMYLNGLVERVFTSPIANPDQKERGGFIVPTISRIAANLWGTETTDINQILRQYDEAGFGFGDMPFAETNFIKKWRGIARTAIVDVAEELSIEVPAFDAADYIFTESNGQQTTIPATQRIDLIFIYAKPIDASSTTIAKFVGGQPTTILKPQLGIVRGAGLGISKTNNSKYIDPTDSEGNLRILANPGDETADNIGFSGLNVKGSFPSPDDLLNLAPTLLENLEANDPVLIGQTVLPIAYVVVKQTASINENQIPIIVKNDLIDIRPFFRTTELTYNERAGLAAATPAPSLANPVATQAELDYELKKYHRDVLGRITEIQTQIGTLNTGGGGGGVATGGGTGNAAPATPRVVGGGYILGGTRYGPEGAIIKCLELAVAPGLNGANDYVDLFKQRYGYPESLEIPNYPSWDISKRVQTGERETNNTYTPYQGQGLYPNDCINYYYKLRQDSSTTPHSEANTKRFSSDLSFNGASHSNQLRPENEIVLFCKKTIRLDKSLVNEWMQDYHVNVSFLNCAPIINIPYAVNRTEAAASYNGIFVDKQPDRFTIYVTWSFPYYYGLDIFDESGNNQSSNNYWGAKIQRFISDQCAGNFMIMNKDILDQPVTENFRSSFTPGVSIYPSVSFQVVGYPRSGQSLATNLTTQDDVIVLS